MSKNSLPSNPQIDQAFSREAKTLDVVNVSSVWSPVVEDDMHFAASVAENSLSLVENEMGEPMCEEVRQTLLHFGAAAGTLALRGLFQPFQSDQIWIDYRDESGLDQADAVRRLTSGVGHESAHVL